MSSHAVFCRRVCGIFQKDGRGLRGVDWERRIENLMKKNHTTFLSDKHNYVLLAFMSALFKHLLDTFSTGHKLMCILSFYCSKSIVSQLYTYRFNVAFYRFIIKLRNGIKSICMFPKTKEEQINRKTVRIYNILTIFNMISQL